MNWKTTFVLLLLAGGCAVLFWKGPDLLSSKPTLVGESETLKLIQSFSPKNLVAIEVISKGKPLVKLQAPAFGQPLELVGNWPVRRAELDELTTLITKLESRFTPIPLTEKTDLKAYGLSELREPVTVQVKINDTNHTLLFGQPAPTPGENPFTRPTYLRIDEKKELLRLGPDVMPILRRTEEDYRLRRLFPEKTRLRVTDEVAPELSGEERPSAKSTELLDDRVTKIRVDGPAGSYVLERVAELPAEKSLANRPTGEGFVTPAQLADSWRLAEPVSDHVDPAKLKTILTALADLWVDRFLQPDEAARLGFPLASNAKQITSEQQTASGSIVSGAGLLVKGDVTPTLTISFKDGTSRTLKIGKVSRSERKVEPPPQLPGAPPLPPRETTEDWRIAQLGDNPLPFEVKADKLKELFFSFDTGIGSASVSVEGELRDPKLIYAPTGDVTRVEVQRPNRLPLILERTKQDAADKKETRWDMLQPVRNLAEAAPVEELLSAMNSARVSKEDIVAPEKAKDLNALDLDPLSATKIVVTLGEKSKTLYLGKREGGKLYARVEGWDRVNRIDDRLFELADRGARVYRSLKLFDLASGNSNEGNRVESILVQNGPESYRLQEIPGLVSTWNLTAPVKVTADIGKASNLARELGSLQATEYLYDPPSYNETLRAGSIFGSALLAQQALKEAEFGLEQPTMKVTLAFAGPKKMEPQTLLIGKPREGKPEVYARLESSPNVFAVPKASFDTLGSGSLAMLPTEIVSASPDQLTSIEITRAGEAPFILQFSDKVWKLTSPIQTPVDASLVQPLTSALTGLRVERYEAHTSNDLAKYGLQAPVLRVRFTITDSKPKAGIEPTKERILLIGNPDGSEKAGRYAKLENEPSIFIIPEETFKAADLSMFELIDRKLLSLNTAFATRVELTSAEGELKLTREQNPWKVEGAAFPLDLPTLEQLLSRFKDLRAEKFAAFGGQIDFAKYGLDPAGKPLTVTVALDKETHKVELGKPVDEKQPNGSRYARVDGAQAVAILNGAIASDLSKSRLEFVERSLIKFDPIELTGITRTKGEQSLELKQGVTGGWEITKPIMKPADAETLEDLSSRVSKLRAEKIVALDSKDLAKYGLEKPEAVVTFELIDQRSGREVKRSLKLGKPVDEKKPEGDRYAQVEGSELVAIVAAPVARRLLGEPIRFLNRSLASFINADRIEVTHGERKLIFQKDAGWKLKSPVDADAEDEPLRELHDMLARLRADDIVAEKPQNLAEYGLDKPEFIWKLFAGDKELLTLLVGKREKDDFRRYAKLEKGDLVVLLDRGVSSRLESEYRKRSLGERIDPMQISELILSGPAGKVTLSKLGPIWMDPNKPDEQWNYTAINELASALANAQIEEYVKDKDANLNEFGLDPTQARTVTIRTGMGQSRTLLLGKRDPSNRLYAKQEDKTRTEVFVLSEMDSKRLNRTRADLLKSDKELLPVPKEKKE